MEQTGTSRSCLRDSGFLQSRVGVSIPHQHAVVDQCDIRAVSTAFPLFAASGAQGLNIQTEIRVREFPLIVAGLALFAVRKLVVNQ